MQIRMKPNATFAPYLYFLIGTKIALVYSERRKNKERVWPLKPIFDQAEIAYILFTPSGMVLDSNPLAGKWLSSEQIDDIQDLPQDLIDAFKRCKSRTSVNVHLDQIRVTLKKCTDDQKEYILLTAQSDPEFFELEQIIMMSFDEIMVTDGEGIIQKVNKKCEELYGLPADQLVGRKTMDLEKEQIFTPSLTPKVKKERKKVSCIQMTTTGKQLYVIGTPLFDATGNITRIIFNSREASEIEILKSQLAQTEQLLDHYKTEVTQLKNVIQSKKEVIYQSKEMKDVYQLAEKLAGVDSTVIITGETGVGKGVIARYIHQKSARKDQKLIEVNCGAIPEQLIESELFGYVPGAFTGASKQGKKGVLESADQGTLFLDEIAELSPPVQVKLLHFLQDQTFRRVGGQASIHVNIRIIAATNKNLFQLVKNGEFREDLFYRLNVIPISIPPLRHRHEDITVLADWFLAYFNSKYQTSKTLSNDIRTHFMRYAWPGNVRELENLIERLVVTSDSKIITETALPDNIRDTGQTEPRITVKGIFPLKQAVNEVEKQLILNSYYTYKNTYKCAEALQVNQSTIVRKMKKYMTH